MHPESLMYHLIKIYNFSIKHMSNYNWDNKEYLKRVPCSTFRFEENTANSNVWKTVQFLQNLTPNLPEWINCKISRFR